MNSHYNKSWNALNDLEQNFADKEYILKFLNSIENKHKSGTKIVDELKALKILFSTYFDELDVTFSNCWKDIIANYPRNNEESSSNDFEIMPDDVFEELMSDTNSTTPEDETWIRTIDESGNLELPSELIDKLELEVGDYLQWITEDDGLTFILKKVNNVSQIMEFPN
jgi:hypothetical protein